MRGFIQNITARGQKVSVKNKGKRLGVLNVGVVGMGGRGRYLARCFGERPQVALRAVCDTDRVALRTCRRMFGDGVAYYRDLEEMCAREELQIGVVASWDRCHRARAQIMLKHNLNVYLEKPMAQSVEDCDAILRAWQKSSGVLLVGLELRHCTLCRDMRRLLDQGAIGEVKLGMAVDNVSVGGQYYFHGRQRRREFIKSLVLEKGTHTLDLMNWFIGARPVRVFAEGGLDFFGGRVSNARRCRSCSRRRTCDYFIDYRNFVMDYGASVTRQDFCVWAREVDVEDNTILTVRYDNGAKVTYMECHFTPDYNRQFTLIGAGGRMTAFYNNEQEFVIRVQKRAETKVAEYHPPRSAGGHGGGDPRILDDFLARVRRGEHSCPGVPDARNSAAIAIAAAQSSVTNLPVKIKPCCIPS